MIPLKLLYNPNKNLVSFNILVPFFLYPDSIEMVDVFKSLSQFYHLLLFLTQHSQASFARISAPITHSAVSRVDLTRLLSNSIIRLMLGVVALTSLRVPVVCVIGDASPHLFGYSGYDFMRESLFLE